MYIITIYTKTGRARNFRYETLDKAIKAASNIFNKTGIVVGINKEN